MISHLYIIYNPTSTGNSKTLAEDLKTTLTENQFDIEVSLLKTKYPGHFVDLAKQLAGENVMLVASSGDGGFNELINGVLASDYPDTVVGLLPGGNANDHYNFRHQGDLIERIKNFDVKSVDVIKVSYDNQLRYAHSYVGLGMTATIGEVLNQHKLNPVKEVWLVIRQLFHKTPVRIKVDDKKKLFDSLIFTVVDRISKYFAIGEQDQASDGTFDIISLRSKSFLGTIRWILHHLVRPVKPMTRAKSFQFVTYRLTKIQVDGELIEVTANQKVAIDCDAKKLRCII